MRDLGRYFVETHEYNIETGRDELLEYFEYDLDVIISNGRVEYLNHHTVLTMAIL